jgi:hypothetical protein
MLYIYSRASLRSCCGTMSRRERRRVFRTIFIPTTQQTEVLEEGCGDVGSLLIFSQAISSLLR